MGTISNIGEPFNSTSNDMGFVISGAGAEAFFVRDLDVWFADLSGVDEYLKPKETVLVYGKIEVNQQPVEMTVVVVSDDKILGQARSNSKGVYELSIPGPIKAFSVSVLEDRKGMFSTKIIEPINSKRYSEFPIDFIYTSKNKVEDQSVKKEAPSQLRELVVYFDFDSDVIPEDEAAKVQKAISEFMEPNQNQFAVTGYTDLIGQDAYNMSLSKSRAEAVVKFLKKAFSVDQKRFLVDFKGEQNPLNSGSTQSERAKNRRVVIRVTKI